MTMASPLRMLILVMAAAMMFVAGCADVSMDAYERIEIGMHIDEVRHIMGTDGQTEEVRGRSISAAGVVGGTASPYRDQIHTWTSGHKKIVVHTRDGVVTDKHTLGF